MAGGDAGTGGRRRSGVRTALASRLGVDARALAALRVALGLLLLADLALRATDLVAHYTDRGALPRAALAEVYPRFADLSLHALSGSAAFQAGLFLLAAAFGVALLVGYRTRLAVVASLVLLVSLQLRNPLVLNAGDALLARLLVWGAFLPLGGRWSVDARRRAVDGGDGPRAGGRVATLGTAALLLQVVVVYAANAAFKLQGSQWRSGEAIRTVFGLDHLTVLAGDALAGYPALLVAADRAWLAMLLAAPLLLVLVGRARALLAGAFVAAHLGMALTLRLGFFPLVSVAALLPFLPPSVWSAVERRVPTAVGDAARRGTDRLARHLPAGPRTNLPWAGGRRRVSTGAVAVLLAAMLAWNAATLGLVGVPAVAAGTVDPAEQRWDMFAPEPRADDGWYVVPGELESGARVDAFRGGPATFERPPELAATFPSHRWFVYLLDLRAASNAPLRDDFAAYLCRRWNRAHADDLVSLTVYYVEEPVRLDGPEERRRIELARHECGPS